MQLSMSLMVSPELIGIGFALSRTAKSSGPRSGKWILKRGCAVAGNSLVIHSKVGSPWFIPLAEKNISLAIN